jgi:hypothetical protein
MQVAVRECNHFDWSRLEYTGRMGGAMNTNVAKEPGVGDSAPDLVYRNGAGESRRLSALWTDAPALIVWLRHFG